MASPVQYQVQVKASPTAAWTPNKAFESSNEAETYARTLMESAKYAEVRIETLLAGGRRATVRIAEDMPAAQASPARKMTIWATIIVAVLGAAMIGMLGYEAFSKIH